MSVSDSIPHRPAPLGVIHLLGWMTGIALVLGAYRATLELGWLGIPRESHEETRWWQLGYGLVYGTAISTLGLLFYRRWRGDTHFPVHPGHWLLVMGGLAFFIDGIAFGAARGLHALWTRQFPSDPGWFYLQQSLAWGTALVVAILFLRNLRTNWNWLLLAGLIAGLIAVNWWTNLLILGQVVTQILGYPMISGEWPYYLVHYAQIIAVGICLLAMPVIIGCDRHERDWLHWVGVGATVMLALVEAANHVTVLVRST